MAVAPTRRQAPPTEVSTLDQVSQFFQRAFPAINAARVSVADGAADAAAKGDYARAAGNVARGMVSYPVAAVNDTLAPVGQVIAGAAPFVGGLFGSKGDTSVVKTNPVVAAPVQARQAVGDALAAGRAAAPEITPQDALSGFLRQVLTSPKATMGDLTRAGALVPAVAKGAPKLKDTVLAQTAALSQAIYEDQATKIDAAVKAGTITADQGVVGKEKATAAYFARNGGLVGFDPTKLVQANLLDQDEEN